MKIKLATCWVAMREFDNSSATLEIEGVGDQTIREPLPQHLKAQIEEYYIRCYHERMNAARARGEAA